MEYTINKLAHLSGVSTRTLRYYDQIGLLVPKRVSANGYRIYGQQEVDALQQILFYRELGFPLDEISRILQDPKYDKQESLTQQLVALKQRKQQIDDLIHNLTRTIKTLKGEIQMNDQEKFEGFKNKLVSDNEKQYGDELRQKYGQDQIDQSNAKVKGMSEEQWQMAETLRCDFMDTLTKAFNEGDPKSVDAQKACDLHRQWLCVFWDQKMYTKQAHIGLAEMYCADERFKAHYDVIADGCAEFLKEAIIEYCK